jgi:hypothetical protein
VLRAYINMWNSGSAQLPRLKYTAAPFLLSAACLLAILLRADAQGTYLAR